MPGEFHKKELCRADQGSNSLSLLFLSPIINKHRPLLSLSPSVYIHTRLCTTQLHYLQGSCNKHHHHHNPIQKHTHTICVVCVPRPWGCSKSQSCAETKSKERLNNKFHVTEAITVSPLLFSLLSAPAATAAFISATSLSPPMIAGTGIPNIPKLFFFRYVNIPGISRSVRLVRSAIILHNNCDALN